MTYQTSQRLPCVLCGSPSVARHLCKPCYYKMRGQDRLDEFSLLGPTDVFWMRVKKTEHCWLWTGTTNYYGYGIFLLPGEVPVRAHRFAYELTRGKIPKGKVVMHVCDNPPCVNPDHLEIGTRLENNRDAIKKRRNAFGERNGQARLSAKQIQEIRDSNESQVTLAAKYGVCPSHVSRIKSRQIRKNG